MTRAVYRGISSDLALQVYKCIIAEQPFMIMS